MSSAAAEGEKRLEGWSRGEPDSGRLMARRGTRARASGREEGEGQRRFPGSGRGCGGVEKGRELGCAVWCVLLDIYAKSAMSVYYAVDW